MGVHKILPSALSMLVDDTWQALPVNGAIELFLKGARIWDEGIS